MLEDFKDGQVIFYNVLTSSIKNNRVSHAYLFENKGNDNYMNIVLSFVKALICPKKKLNNSDCGDCCLCKRIDEGNYPEIKIIKPDGLWIKKEQLLELQLEFNKTSIEGNKRIYIILDCEKLNVHAANSMLKFLEEPVEGVIALLVTNNKELVLETIKSRCQSIVILKQDVENFIDENIVSNVVEFIKMLENKKNDSIIYMKKLFLDKFPSRIEINQALKVMILFYYDVFLDKLGTNVKYFFNYLDVIQSIKGNFYEIARKLEILIKNEYYVRYNLNINLLISRIIIELGG